VGYGIGVQHLPPELQKKAWDVGLTEEEARGQLANYAAGVRERLKTTLGGAYVHLDRPRQMALESMMYNLGETKFRGFDRTLRHLREGNFEKTADEMLDSDWYRNPKTKRRAEELASIMRTGQLPEWLVKKLADRRGRMRDAAS